MSQNYNIGIDVDGTLTKEKIGKEIMGLNPGKIAKVMLDCTPKNGIDVLLETNHSVYIITGRPERYKEVTIDWLDAYGIPYQELTMFPNNFYTIHGYSIPKYVGLKLDMHIQKDISLAIDDNADVINMFNQFGICACKVEDNFRDAFEKVLGLKDGVLQQYLEKHRVRKTQC